MSYKTVIANRFARTKITMHLKNSGEESEDFTLPFILPKSAFISDSILEVEERTYTAFVQKKEDSQDDNSVRLTRFKEILENIIIFFRTPKTFMLEIPM